MDGRVGMTAMNFAFAFVILLGFFMLRYRLLKEQQASELGRPLLANDRGGSAHRLDTATREAAKGYNVCKVCAFENFKASRFCTICGAPIANGSGGSSDDNDDSDAGIVADVPVASGVELHRAADGLLGVAATVDGGSDSAATAVVGMPKLTPRQIRARRRKEWTRKLDVEGKMFWYRESSVITANTSGMAIALSSPGFVVAFDEAEAADGTSDELAHNETAAECNEHAADCATQLESTASVLTAVASEMATQVTAPSSSQQPSGSVDDAAAIELQTGASASLSVAPPTESPAPSSSAGKTTIALRTAPLRFLTHDVHVSVLEASQADAAVLSTVLSSSDSASSSPSSDRNDTQPTTVLDSIERRREAIALAGQDFPTKFAHFVVSCATLLVPADTEFLKVAVHRAFVLEESMEHLACLDARFLRSVLRIEFIGESGVDAGGLHREWFALLHERLMTPEAGLFVCTDARANVYMLNAHSRRDCGDDHLVYLYATGRLLGRALLEGVVLNVHLALPLRKLVLGIPVTIDDLEDVDAETFRSMQWIAQHDGVDALALDFSVTVLRQQQQQRERIDDDDDDDDDSSSSDTNNDFGMIKSVNESINDSINSSITDVEVIDLIPGGRDVPVTDANKHLYLERKFHYTVFESVAPQLHALLKGLHEVVPPSLLTLFDAEELDYLLCGSQAIDVDDWVRWSVHAPALALTPVLTSFWAIVRAMPNEYRRRLLQFTTGCACVPLVGFRGLTSYDGKVCLFTLKALPAAGPQYIRSHACFNRIDLPLGATKRELRTMLYAILDTEAYGFTTT